MSTPTAPPSSSPAPAARLALFLLSASTLTFEINLARLFSVAQFYHFAFMIVSLALLGFGASGTALALVPHLSRQFSQRHVAWLALATGLSSLGAYVLTNWLPFDSFSIAWDRRQVFILALHYIALASPFLFSGLVIGALLAAHPMAAGSTYAVNLLGSAAGCLIALAAPAWLGGEGTVVLGAGLAVSAGAVSAIGARRETPPVRVTWPAIVVAALMLMALADFGVRLGGRRTFDWLELRLSPYKSLSYALQYPGAEVIYRRWNAFSRVDLVRSPGIRSLPGLSYRFLQPPPPEDGLLVDGDELSPVVRAGASLGFADYLPAGVAFRLRPGAEALVLEPRGGLDVLTALALGAERVTAVEANPLLVEASKGIYDDPRVRLVVESDRSYIRRAAQKFEVVVLSLATSYHPVRSGAYSLAEDYRYTVESFHDLLARLNPDGLLIVTRWLQTPPSECLRTFALAITAIERSGGDPRLQIVAFRGYSTMTFLIRNGAFTPDELEAIRRFTSDRAFDLVYAPGLDPGEVNRYNILPEPVYSQTFTAMLEAQPRDSFYAAYPFDVSPPTDDRPFFGHFFKWSQAGQVLAEFGRTWQPFGGAGYFVIVALLILATLLAVGLIVAPLLAMKRRPSRSTVSHLIYFGLIGLAFLLVEIPLIQRFILFLDHPAYALTTVLFALLFFSGLGSQWGRRFPIRRALAALVAILFVAPVLLPALFERTLGSPLMLRVGLTTLLLAPVGFLMGLPCPAGVERLARSEDGAAHIPWAWAVNGASSVISAVLAALLAISLGFSWVLGIGALCYVGAWITVAASSPRPSPHPGP